MTVLSRKLEITAYLSDPVTFTLTTTESIGLSERISIVSDLLVDQASNFLITDIGGFIFTSLSKYRVSNTVPAKRNTVEQVSFIKNNAETITIVKDTDYVV
jgi:hypothetical protein